MLHAPSDGGEGGIVWTLSLVDLAGVPVARELVVEPAVPLPLSELVQPHLDVIGCRVAGEWVTGDDTQGKPKHYARIA